MKRIFALLTALCTLVSLCLFAVSCASDGVPEGMQEVTAAGESFHLYVPASWQAQHNSGISGARYGNQDKSNVTVLRYDSEKIGFTDPESYWNGVLKNSYIAQYGETLTLHEEHKDDTMGGVTGKRYVMTYTADKVTRKQLQILVKGIVDGDLYIFTYTATPELYDTHMAEVDQILANFKFG